MSSASLHVERIDSGQGAAPRRGDTIAIACSGRGYPGAIPPSATLMFEVDLLSIG